MRQPMSRLASVASAAVILAVGLVLLRFWPLRPAKQATVELGTIVQNGRGTGLSDHATMLALLRNSRGRELENMIAHSQPSYSRPTGSLPAGVSFASDNSYSGPSFLERLFGAPTPSAPIPGRRLQQRRIITR